MMPQTVPKSPTNGVTAPVIASHGTLRSRRVMPSDDAICIERWMAGRLWTVPVVPTCRLNSATAPSSTSTRGLGRNWSAAESTSCMRWDLRKARMKRPLCTRARLMRRHLERITPQESTLKAIRIKRTTLATAPVWRIRSTISPPTKDARTGEKSMEVRRVLLAIIEQRLTGSRAGYPVGQRGAWFHSRGRNHDFDFIRLSAFLQSGIDGSHHEI